MLMAFLRQRNEQSELISVHREYHFLIIMIFLPILIGEYDFRNLFGFFFMFMLCQNDRLDFPFLLRFFLPLVYRIPALSVKESLQDQHGGHLVDDLLPFLA